MIRDVESTLAGPADGPAVVTDGLISDFAIYCCGDWDGVTVRRHAAEVTLLRS